MQVFFIRHAQSENNANFEENGNDELRKSDPALTEIGLQQARITAEYLATSHPEKESRLGDPHNIGGFGLTHIYCSLMERAVQTGHIIAESLGLPLFGKVNLHEIGGIYLKKYVDGNEIIETHHGHPSAYLSSQYPQLVLPEGINPVGWWRGGLESVEEKIPRAQSIVDFLKQTHGGTDDRVGVITHGGIYKSIFRVLFNVAPGTLFTLWINNCSITRLDFGENGVTLMYQNRVSYLPDTLLT